MPDDEDTNNDKTMNNAIIVSPNIEGEETKEDKEVVESENTNDEDGDDDDDDGDDEDEDDDDDDDDDYDDDEE